MVSLVDILKAMSDGTRLDILKSLCEQELCVYEIMSKTKLSQSTISHHLKILKTAGLVESTKQGKWIIYRINEETMAKLKDEISTLINQFCEGSPEREDSCDHCDELIPKLKSLQD